jgi:hypothetical protein
MPQGQQNKANALDSYVTVAERIGQFYQAYPQGRITTQIIEHDADSGFILFRAEVFRGSDDAEASATGHAFELRGESYVNKTSYVENCETSAVGRALALLGFEVKRDRDSQRQSAGREQQSAPTKPGPRPTEQAAEQKTTEQRAKSFDRNAALANITAQRKLAREIGTPGIAPTDLSGDLSRADEQMLRAIFVRLRDANKAHADARAAAEEKVA